MLNIPKATDKSYADGKILRSVSDGVGVVTFNNPDKRNAMSLDMWEGFGHALVELRDDPEVRVVILTGAGDKAFVSGADISQFEKTRHKRRSLGGILQKERRAAGAAGGLSEADHRLHPGLLPRRRHADGDGGGYPHRLRQQPVRHSPAAKLGIAYGYDGLKNLVSLVGPSWARLIMYTGMRIDSAEALRIGLVDRVVPDAELWNATTEIARTISGNAPLAIQAAKITIAQVLKDESQRDMAAVKAIGTACMDSEDFREGRTAFMEKRKPEFKGR